MKCHGAGEITLRLDLELPADGHVPLEQLREAAEELAAAHPERKLHNRVPPFGRSRQSPARTVRLPQTVRQAEGGPEWLNARGERSRPYTSNRFQTNAPGTN
jgi:hypothetical protein